MPRKFDVGMVNVAEGLRAGVACAVPVFLGEALEYPDLSWAAIAAFWICLADPGGPVRGRFVALVTLACLGALSCDIAIRATSLSVWLAVLLAFVWSFAGSFARIYDEAAAKVGQFVLVTFLVSIGNFDGRAVDPGMAALLYLAGASWALILTLVLWQIHPHGPSRRALAELYGALAGFAAELAQLCRATRIEGDPWGTMARDHRRRIRELLDTARATIASIGRTHLGRSRRSDQQLILLQCADRIFEALIALSDLLETRQEQPPELTLRAALVDRLDRMPGIFETLSSGILAGSKSLAPPLEANLRELGRLASQADSTEHQDLADHRPSLDLFRHLIETVFLYSSSAAVAAADAGQRASMDVSSEPLSDTRRNLRDIVFIPLAQNLNLHSVPLRHSLRLAVAASIALLITFGFELGHGYWLTMTTVVILQPYAATTWELSLKRIVGSVLGGILAAALGVVIHTPQAIALAIFPISVATMFFRTVDYGLHVLFLTPQFVLISALAEPGTGDLSLSWLRAVNTVLGGILALAAGALLWPGWELRQLPAELAKAIAANLDYLSRVHGARVHGARLESFDAGRRLAGLASNNAEASVQRLLSEPGNDPVVLEAAMTIVTSIRRLTGAITVLWLLPGNPATQQALLGFEALVGWISDALQAMANAASRGMSPATLKNRPEFPPTATGQEDQHAHALVAEVVERICRQIEIMHAALARLAAPQPRPARPEATSTSADSQPRTLL